MNKEQLRDEVINFIEFYSSDEAERGMMTNALEDYIEEVFVESGDYVKNVMVFTFDEQIGGNRYLKKAIGDASPTREFIPEEELHLWIKKYLDAGWEVKVQGEVY